MRTLILGAVTAAMLAAVAFAQRPARTPADVIQTRQAGYKQLAAAFKGLNDQVRASEPSLAVIRQHSAVIVRLAPRVRGWFPRGSGPEAGVRTRAKAEIWSNWPAFRTPAINLFNAARRVDAAARRDDLAAVRAAIPALGGACRDCHDQFRGPEN